MPVLAANGVAIVGCSVANFCLGDRWAFAAGGGEVGPALNGGNGLAVGLVGAAGGDGDFGGDGVGEGHADAVFRAQDDHGAGLDGLAGGQLEVVFAEEPAQDHEDLQHGVVAADAAARAAAEGQVGEGRLRACRWPW